MDSLSRVRYWHLACSLASPLRLQAKIDAHKNKGGGKAGKAQRMSAQAPLKCTICLVLQPSVKSMEQHYDSKHSKVDFPRADYEAMVEANKTGASAGAGGGGGRR